MEMFTMTINETDCGLEVVHIVDREGENDDRRKSSSAPPVSCSERPELPLKSTHPTAGSLTESSSLSTDNPSYELEYSDEDMSIASEDDDNSDEGFIGSADLGSKFGDQQPFNKTNNVDETSDIVFPSIQTLDLVIDEMPSIQKKSYIGKTQLNVSQPIPPTSIRSRKNKQKINVMACPCCRSYVDCTHQKNDPRLTSPSHGENDSSINALTSFVDGLWSNPKDDHNASTKSNQTSPSSMTKALGYTVKRQILEGWLYKKGTGNDLFGSTYWKPRWCSLVLAKIPNYEREVPLLLISWHLSMSPSDIIFLESSVAISVDQGNNSTDKNDHIHCFDIISTMETKHRLSNPISQSNKNLYKGKLAKTFSGELENRNKWVSTINATVQNYERSKVDRSRQYNERLLPPTSPIRRRTNNEPLIDFDLNRSLDNNITFVKSP